MVHAIELCLYPDSEQYRLLAGRRDQYKTAALQAKQRGDSQTAIKYIKTAKVRGV